MVIFRRSLVPVDYPEAISEMTNYVQALSQGEGEEKVWLLEHPPLYTIGTKGQISEISEKANLPYYITGRGGRVTYHGPGQRIAYVMLNLASRQQQDLRKYVWMLEEWLISALKDLDVQGERREGRVGIWVRKANSFQDYKIAALGIRIRKWITFHGVSLNVNPDLSHYQHIVACGLAQYGVTSLKELGCDISLKEVDELLIRKFKLLF